MLFFTESDDSIEYLISLLLHLTPEAANAIYCQFYCTFSFHGKDRQSRLLCRHSHSIFLFFKYLLFSLFTRTSTWYRWSYSLTLPFTLIVSFVYHLLSLNHTCVSMNGTFYSVFTSSLNWLIKISHPRYWCGAANNLIAIIYALSRYFSSKKQE